MRSRPTLGATLIELAVQPVVSANEIHLSIRGRHPSRVVLRPRDPPHLPAAPSSQRLDKFLEVLPHADEVISLERGPQALTPHVRVLWRPISEGEVSSVHVGVEQTPRLPVEVPGGEAMEVGLVW